MLGAKRLEEIMNLLTRAGSVDAARLGEALGVTAKTVRKDLDKLEAMGLLIRVHGGAVLKDNGDKMFPIEQRKRKNIAEKQRIGRAALAYVEDGDTIILDGGTTTIELARLLGDKKVTVITNDLCIAAELMYKENVTLHVCGGKLRREGAYTLLGRDAERFMERYQVRKLFLGTSALDFTSGLSVFSQDEAELKKAMLDAAREVICLTDYSKFHEVAFTAFCPLARLNVLITDARIAAADWQRLADAGVKVDVV